METQVQLHLLNFSAFYRFAESETKTTRLIAEYHKQGTQDFPLRFFVTGSVEEGFPDIDSDVDWMVVLNGDEAISQDFQTNYIHPLPETPVHLKIETSVSLDKNIDEFIESFSNKCLIRELIHSDGNIKYISAEKARKLNQHDFMPENLWNVPAFSKDLASGDDSVTSPSYSLKSPTLQSITCDRVPALQCAGWPTEMKEWLDRKRQCWPNLETIEEIRDTGFCLVPKPSGIQGDIEKEWRYSFSIAEVKLFKTFNESQKKVYYMLRAIYVRYLKVALEKEAISSYHIKTVMFWTMEKQAPSYWSKNETNFILIGIFTDLHKNLVDGYQAHYFLPTHNLLYNVSRKELNVAADVIITMIQQFKNVLIQMSRTHTLGLLPRYAFIDYQAEAGRNEQILKFPLNQAYNLIIEKSAEMNKARKKLKNTSLLACLDKIVLSLKDSPTHSELMDIYRPLIMCGYQFIIGCSKSSAGKLEFNKNKASRLDAQCQEINVRKLNQVAVFCVRFFKHCLSLGNEEEFFQLTRQPLLFLMEVFLRDFPPLDSTENISPTLQMFHEVCKIIASNFQTNDGGKEMDSLYDSLVITCKKYTSSSNDKEESRFDERSLFMLVGGTYLKIEHSST